MKYICECCGKTVGTVYYTGLGELCESCFTKLVKEEDDLD